MKQSFTPDFLSCPNDQSHKELMNELTHMLKQSFDGCKPGKMAVRNIMGYAAALEVISDRQHNRYQILIN